MTPEYLDRLKAFYESELLISQSSGAAAVPSGISPPKTGQGPPVRITNAAPEYVVNEYSSICPFSYDNSELLLFHADGYVGLHNGDGVFYGILPPMVHTSSRPRWSKSSPHVFTFLSGNQLLAFNIDRKWDKDAISIVHTFSQFKTINDAGEADLSEDGDHRVLVGDDHTVFVYQFSKDRYGAGLLLPPFNNVYITSDNNVLVSGADGVVLYNENMNKIRRLGAMGHMDTARFNGREVLIWCSSNDPTLNLNAVVMIDLGTPDVGKPALTILAVFDWRLAIHVSTCDKPFALASTYAPDNSIPSQIFRVPFDGSGAQFVCDTHSTMIKVGEGIAYNPEPRASLSRDGSRYVFASNSGNVGISNDYAETFLGTLA